MLMLILNVVYVLIAIAIIALVLMQRGTGAAAGSGFGAGASGTVFGARGASNFLSKSTKYLAIAVNTMVSFFDPEMIVLGGGISMAGQFLLDAIKEKIPSFLMYKTLPYGKLELAVLGNSAGIIGAAMLGMVLKEGETL